MHKRVTEHQQQRNLNGVKRSASVSPQPSRTDALQQIARKRSRSPSQASAVSPSNKLPHIPYRILSNSPNNVDMSKTMHTNGLSPPKTTGSDRPYSSFELFRRNEGKGSNKRGSSRNPTPDNRSKVPETVHSPTFKDLFSSGDNDTDSEQQPKFYISTTDDDDSIPEFTYQPRSSLLRQTFEDEQVGLEMPTQKVTVAEYKAIEEDVEKDIARINSLSRKELLPSIVQRLRRKKINERIKEKQERKGQIVDGLSRIDQLLHEYEQNLEKHDSMTYLENTDISEIIAKDHISRESIMNVSLGRAKEIVDESDLRQYNRNSILRGLKYWVDRHNVDLNDSDDIEELLNLERELDPTYNQQIQDQVDTVQKQITSATTRLAEIFATYRDLKSHLTNVEWEETMREEARKVFLKKFQEKLMLIESDLSVTLTDIDEANAAVLVLKLKINEKSRLIQKLIERDKINVEKIRRYKSLYIEHKRLVDEMVERLKKPDIRNLIDIKYIVTGIPDTSDNYLDESNDDSKQASYSKIDKELDSVVKINESDLKLAPLVEEKDPFSIALDSPNNATFQDSPNTTELTADDSILDLGMSSMQEVGARADEATIQDVTQKQELTADLTNSSKEELPLSDISPIPKKAKKQIQPKKQTRKVTKRKQVKKPKDTTDEYDEKEIHEQILELEAIEDHNETAEPVEDIATIDPVWLPDEDYNFEYDVNFTEQDEIGIIDVERHTPSELNLRIKVDHLMKKLRCLEREKLAQQDYDAEQFQKLMEREKQYQQLKQEKAELLEQQSVIIQKLQNEISRLRTHCAEVIPQTTNEGNPSTNEAVVHNPELDQELEEYQEIVAKVAKSDKEELLIDEKNDDFFTPKPKRSKRKKNTKPKTDTSKDRISPVKTRNEGGVSSTQKTSKDPKPDRPQKDSKETQPQPKETAPKPRDVSPPKQRDTSSTTPVKPKETPSTVVTKTKPDPQVTKPKEPKETNEKPSIKENTQKVNTTTKEEQIPNPKEKTDLREPTKTVEEPVQSVQPVQRKGNVSPQKSRDNLHAAQKYQKDSISPDEAPATKRTSREYTSARTGNDTNRLEPKDYSSRNTIDASPNVSHRTFREKNIVSLYKNGNEDSKTGNEIIEEVEQVKDTDELRGIIQALVTERENMIEMVYGTHMRVRKFFEFVANFVSQRAIDPGTGYSYADEDFVSDWIRLHKKLERSERKRLKLEEAELVDSPTEISPIGPNGKRKLVTNREIMKDQQQYAIDQQEEEAKVKRNSLKLYRSIPGLLLKLYMAIKQFRYRKNIKRNESDNSYGNVNLAGHLRRGTAPPIKKVKSKPRLNKRVDTPAPFSEAQSIEEKNRGIIRMLKHQAASKRRWEEKKMQIMKERKEFLFVEEDEEKEAEASGVEILAL